MVRIYLVFGKTFTGDYENILFTLSRAYAARYALKTSEHQRRQRRRRPRYLRVFVHEIDISESGHVARPLDWLEVVECTPESSGAHYGEFEYMQDENSPESC